MPLPIAHSAAGLAGYLAFRKRTPTISAKQELFLLGSCLFLANLPDLDFIPGFLCGDPGRFHHGLSHSLAVGLIGALIFYRFVWHRLKGISTPIKQLASANPCAAMKSSFLSSPHKVFQVHRVPDSYHFKVFLLV